MGKLGRALVRESKVPVYCVLLAPGLPDMTSLDRGRSIDEISPRRARIKSSEEWLRE